MQDSTFSKILSRLNILSMWTLIFNIKNKNQYPYSFLTEFARYLEQRNISASTLKQRVVTVKNFLEYHDIDISPRRFKVKVKSPSTIRKTRKHYLRKTLQRY